MDEKIVEKWLGLNKGDYRYDDFNGKGFASASGKSGGIGWGFSDTFIYPKERPYGFGYGCASGNGNEEGNGYGMGYNNIEYFNKQRVWKIDGLYTIITSIHNNVAKGFILNQDFSLEKTYVVKEHNCFAHGTTIQGAMQSLEIKIFGDMDIEEKIDEFKNKFDKNKKYSGHDFFVWHHNLTGSCLQGRNSFVKDKNIDLDKMYSVSEFLQIVKGAYGWSVLEQLEEDYK